MPTQDLLYLFDLVYELFILFWLEDKSEKLHQIAQLLDLDTQTMIFFWLGGAIEAGGFFLYLAELTLERSFGQNYRWDSLVRLVGRKCVESKEQ